MKMWQQVLACLDRPKSELEVAASAQTSATVTRIALNVLLRHEAIVRLDNGGDTRTARGEEYLAEMDPRDVPQDMQPGLVPLTAAEETVAHARQHAVVSVWQWAIRGG
jgi:hypothetical protein